jgi:hypothetical protein
VKDGSLRLLVTAFIMFVAGCGANGLGAKETASLVVKAPASVKAASIFVADHEVMNADDQPLSALDDFKAAFGKTKPDCTGVSDCNVDRPFTKPTDYYVYLLNPDAENLDHLAARQKVHVEKAGTAPADWQGDGVWGAAPEGQWMTSVNTPVILTTSVTGGKVVMRFDYEYYDLIVTGDAFHGEHTNDDGSVQVMDGTITEDPTSGKLCTIVWNETKDGAVSGHDTFSSGACP